ncbi:MAG: hypothetical protein RL033_1433 [Pseudomonadota bacterium]
MRVSFAWGAPHGCPVLVLLSLALGCSRPSNQSCAAGAECGSLARSEPTASLVDMPAGALSAGACGDGILDPEREECDDGSACRDGRDCTEESARCQVGSMDRSCAPRAGDGCSAECQLEPGYSCPEVGRCQLTGIQPTSEAPGAVSPGAESANTGSGPIGQAGSPGVAPPASPAGRCELARFEAAERVQGLDLPFDGFQLWAPALSSDGATLYFAVSSPAAPERIFTATRSQRGRRFSNAVPLAGLDSGTGDGTPLPSHDGLRLYFYSRRAGGNGDRDLWLATRTDTSADFAAPALLEVVNTPALEHLPWLSADELTLLFVSTRAGGLGQSDVWLAQRPEAGEAFAPPTLFLASSVSDEGRAVLSSSGRTLIFASDRAGGSGLQDLWSATRTDAAAEFGEATNLGSLNGPATELDPFLSLDERELFFVSDRDGPSELWRAQRRCDD